MPSEGSDGIGVGESAGRSNRTVIPDNTAISKFVIPAQAGI
ncbi:hypothetical protein [Neisseria gonorrhoeae]|nr:hypothetical protein [Neisseria gonorrhoeae]